MEERIATPNSSGNALFLILIAVALFAALSYAVTQSGRGGGAVDKETLSLEVARYMQFVATLDNAVLRMRLTNGCADGALDFADRTGQFTEWQAQNANPNTISADCFVFDPAGGGVTIVPIPSAWKNNPASTSTYAFVQGESCVPNIGTGGTTCGNGAASASDEDLMFIVVDIDIDVCREINRRAWISGIPQDANSAIGLNNADGAYFDGGANDSISDTGGLLHGKMDFCFSYGGTPTYAYVHVLLAR